MSFRVTPDLKKALLNHTKQTGRSLTQEIEYNLERSIGLSQLQVAHQMVFGPQAALIIEKLGEAIRFAIMESGQSLNDQWMRDPLAFNRVVSSIRALADQLEIFRPAGDNFKRGNEANYVHRLFLTMANTEPNKPWSMRAAGDRMSLGPELTERLMAWRAQWEWQSDSTNQREGVPPPKHVPGEAT